MTPDRIQIDAAIQALADARYAGRPIVPLTGGGLSAESGVLTTEGLVRYLAALRCYIHDRIYLPDSWRSIEDHLLAARDKEYRRSLLEFIEDQGWPDPHELNERLWMVHESQVDWRLETEITHQLGLLAEDIYPERITALGETPADAALGHNRRWDAVAHWTDLVRYTTGFDRDYAASLFTRLNRYRRPGLGHRFLAFLARLCGMRLFLTTNVDCLLHQALASEGISFRAYDLGGRPFPAPILLREEVSVLSLFGQEDRPVVDEQHELPLHEQFFTGLRQGLSEAQAPLLLVVGCSGKGRRAMDLVERGFLLGPDRMPVTIPPSRGPAVVWLHYEDALPQPVRQLYLKDPEYRELIVTAGVKSPGQFLRHLYYTLSSRCPAGVEPYAALEQRPTILSQDPPVYTKKEEEGQVIQWSNEDGTVVLFDSFPNDSQPPPSNAPTATEQLVAWMNSQDGFHPIWIELSTQFTLAGVISAVIDQCRLYDPTLPPPVLPLDELDPEKGPTFRAKRMATGMLRQALRRGHYAVAIDGVEAFVWPQTTHHGTVSGGKDKSQRRIQNLLLGFFHIIRRLEATPLKGTRLGLSINSPIARHGKNPLSPDLQELQRTLQKEKRRLEKLWKLTPKRLCGAKKTGPALEVAATTNRQSLRGVLAEQDPPEADGSFLGDTARLALLALSCFRRTRTLVALRAVLGPLTKGLHPGSEKLGPYSTVDKVLGWYCSHEYLLSVEGGLYWMKRPIRDPIYNLCSHHTFTNSICKVFAREGLGDHSYETLAQLILLPLHHDRIARQYYFETYIQSKDPPAFFEYVYHRVSSIRYLTKLALALHAPSTKEQDVEDVCAMLQNVLRPLSPYLGIDDEAWDGMKTPQGLKREVAIRRNREIASLRLAWAVSQESLAPQVPVEQLISWCTWLIEDDLPRFRTAYYRRRVPEELKAATNSSEWRRLCRKLDAPVAEAWCDLRDTLFTHWIQLCRERGDSPAIERVCITYLKQVRKDLTQRSLRLSEAEKEEVRSFQMELRGLVMVVADKDVGPTAVLDGISSLCEAIKKHGSVRRVLRTPLSHGLLHRLLDLLECQLSRDGAGSFPLDALSSLLQEKRHRTLYTRFCLLQAESCGHRLSFAGRRALPSHGDTADNKADVKADEKLLEKMEGWTTRGLTEIRNIDYLQQQSPESISYFYFRTQFLLHRSRARWLRALGNLDFLYREEQFKQAYQDLELARGHLEFGTSRAFLAQTDLASAEAVLCQAGLEMAIEVYSPRAGSKLDIADGYLRRALGHLLNARRNVIWWREYARLRAQYKADRNLWRLQGLMKEGAVFLQRSSPFADVPCDSRACILFWDRIGGMLRQFVRTLRQGFLAVGHGRHLKLQGTGVSGTSPWAGPSLWELFFTALWTGVLILNRPRSPEVAHLLMDPNTQEALFDSELTKIQEYVEYLALRCGINVPQERSKPPQFTSINHLRSEILRLAVQRAWHVNPRSLILQLAKMDGKLVPTKTPDPLPAVTVQSLPETAG